MGFYINQFFMKSFGHTQLYSKWDSKLMKFFMRSFGQTQLYSNEFLY